MRKQFKKIIEDNVSILCKEVGEHFETAWQFVQKSCERVDSCLGAIPDGEQFDERKRDCLLILRNSIADLCCCLDSLERGHTRTVQNNLRMCMEDYALVTMLHTDDKKYNLFRNDKKVKGSDAVALMKNYEHGHEMYNLVWGLLSEISHHTQRHLIARQIIPISSDGSIHTLLKHVDSKDLKHQLIPLSMIVYLLRAIGEYAERMCIELLESTYFWVKNSEGYEQNLNIPLETSYKSLVDKCMCLLDER